MFLFFVELSYGNGLTPGAKPLPPGKSAHGSEIVATPHGRTVVSLPNGGAIFVLKWNCPFTKSYEMPYDPRKDIFPSPFGSHPNPNRGPKVFQFLFIPARLFGKPGSPGYVNPGGAFWK